MLSIVQAYTLIFRSRVPDCSPELKVVFETIVLGRKATDIGISMFAHAF